jgi:hypothetical protein
MLHKLSNTRFARLIPTKLHPSVWTRAILSRAADQKVISGPFAGMRYIAKDESSDSEYYAKLLGSYEQELHSIIEDILVQPFPVIVNVGAAEGYYAVGMARKQSRCRIIAFEENQKKQSSLRQIATANGVAEQITIYGSATLFNFREALMQAPRVCVVMDVEGFERQLLDPETIPKLRHATILVELHDQPDLDLGTLIRSRFIQTHSIEEVWTRPRTLTDLPVRLPIYQRWLLKDYLLVNMAENRGMPMRWHYLQPLVL